MVPERGIAVWRMPGGSSGASWLGSLGREAAGQSGGVGGCFGAACPPGMREALPTASAAARSCPAALLSLATSSATCPRRAPAQHAPQGGLGVLVGLQGVGEVGGARCACWGGGQAGAGRTAPCSLAQQRCNGGPRNTRAESPWPERQARPGRQFAGRGAPWRMPAGSRSPRPLMGGSSRLHWRLCHSRPTCGAAGAPQHACGVGAPRSPGAARHTHPCGPAPAIQGGSVSGQPQPRRAPGTAQSCARRRAPRGRSAWSGG